MQRDVDTTRLMMGTIKALHLELKSNTPSMNKTLGQSFMLTIASAACAVD
jgi:hypothetical protein